VFDILSQSARDLAGRGWSRENIRSLFDRLRSGRTLAEVSVFDAGDQPVTSPCLDLRAVPTGAAEDGTLRFARSVEPAGTYETVLIPGRGRSTVCVSVQVGCRRACAFCATGTMGLQANLPPDEIVRQVAMAARQAGQRGLPPLRNVVFMGMGEPLDNAKSVGAALALLTDPAGWALAPRHLTISSVGPSPRAVALARDWPGRIAWSLHAADDEVRRRLVPTARHPVAELARAFTELVDARRQPLFVEMTLIDGLNDAPELADRAAALFAGRSRTVRFNLLPVNPTGAEFRPSPPERVAAFRDRLRARGFFAMVRRARGGDRGAACGQLVTLPPARCEGEALGADRHPPPLR
jgi:23S rRNA (adenine2503-C2)-methyltransferase